MNREELTELHYISPMNNVASILKHGILSHERVRKLPHESVAMEEIQEIRRGKSVPGGRKLHEYVNLYVSARNPMLYKRKAQHQELCVLRVSAATLDLPNVVIADGNAAVQYTGFRAAPHGLSQIDAELVFAEFWTHDDPIEYRRRKSAKCAEVLVPDAVPAGYLLGAYVSCEDSKALLVSIAPELTVTVNPRLFFRPPEA